MDGPPGSSLHPPRPEAGPALAGRTILTVLAHPDDESLACGGTLARAAAAGARVVVLCASRGELGSVSDPALVPDGDLGAARGRELTEAATCLGAAEVVLLAHADGCLRWIDAPAFEDEVLATVGRTRPDAVITFDADGLYWHPDHVGVHERVTAALAALGTDAPALYYVTLPAGAMRGVGAAARARGAPPEASRYWGIDPDAFGFAAPPPSFRIDVRGWAGSKLAALRSHRTQMGAANPMAWIEEEDVRRWLGFELYRRGPGGGEGPAVLEALGVAVPRP